MHVDRAYLRIKKYHKISSMVFAWYAQGSESSPKYCKNKKQKTGIVSSVFVLT